MRVLQLIDSLRSGGAERIAVNYANALNKRIDASFLCCTRMEGLLKSQLSPEVGYLFLNKQSALDLKAFLKLRNYIKSEKIDLIQAHSSSWFLAVLIKLSLPGLKLVWHDHYGRELKERQVGILKMGSRFFDGIISVNSELKEWAGRELGSKNVTFFRNFLPAAEDVAFIEKRDHTLLNKGGFKIICLANLRPQKDHMNLLKAFELVLKRFSDISLHLVGKDEQDKYSEKLKTFIKQHKLQEKVFLYGEQMNVNNFLKAADLGVLSSASEGLPLAILEYGRARLPVICTEVGECAEVIVKNGILVPPQNPEALAMAVIKYIENKALREIHAENFKNIVINNYSEEFELPRVVELFRKMTLN